MNEELQQKLVGLLRETGRAHHEAFIETDGADPDWPAWYARQLQPALSRLLDTALTQREVAALLISLDQAFQQTAPGGDWADYYAHALLEQYG